MAYSNYGVLDLKVEIEVHASFRLKDSALQYFRVLGLSIKIKTLCFCLLVVNYLTD